MNSAVTSIALDILVFVTGWTHVLLAPFTKVEESFNLHATHDVLMYGVGVENLPNYDHFTFPGAVPRTFIGSVLLAWLSTPVIWVASWLGFVNSKFDLQIIVRLVLASLNAWTLCLIRRGVSHRFGRACGLSFALLTCSQFHLPFWMGRTIPNMFATIPVNYSTYLMVDRPHNSKKPSQASLKMAVALLTCTAVIYRAEVALLLAPLCLQLLVTGRLALRQVIRVGLVSGLLSTSLSVIVDSYLWVKFPLWPELAGIYFNVIQGQSAEWGISPPWTYFTTYLPKLLLASLPLSVIGILADKRMRFLIMPSIVFVALLSFLGHKEWRFIIYVVPTFNIAASRGVRWTTTQGKNKLFGCLLFLSTCGLLLSNLFFTVLSTKASMANYPGGEALLRIHQRRGYYNDTEPSIYISNLAAQTGASLFLHLRSPPHHPAQQQHVFAPKVWNYDKTENLSTTALSSQQFSHLILEVPPESDTEFSRRWELLDVIYGFQRWAINWELLRRPKRAEWLEKMGGVLRYEERKKLWILGRKL